VRSHTSLSINAVYKLQNSKNSHNGNVKLISSDTLGSTSWSKQCNQSLPNRTKFVTKPMQYFTFHLQDVAALPWESWTFKNCSVLWINVIIWANFIQTFAH